MSRIVAEITKDTPEPTYRYVATCSGCVWTDSWPLEGMAAAHSRLHIRQTKHERVMIEDTEAQA